MDEGASAAAFSDECVGPVKVTENFGGNTTEGTVINGGGFSGGEADK